MCIVAYQFKSVLAENATSFCCSLHDRRVLMSLHYLVKLKLFIGQVLPLSCRGKKLRNFSQLNVGLQIRQI